jgi:hypothetical protein
MRQLIRLLGIVMVLQGISGAIDHLAVQPFLGFFLNLFNRFVVSRVELLDGYELLANLLLAALGAAVVTVAEQVRPA